MASENENKPAIKLDVLQYPTLSYVAGVEPKPATSSVDGNVTVNTAAEPGRAGYFETSINISADLTWNGATERPSFYLRIPVPSDTDDAPYRQVCDQALDHLAPLLRSLADQVDEELEAIRLRETERQAAKKL